MNNAWSSERHALGVPDMDDNHREFLERVAALGSCADGEFAGLFQKLVDQTRLHFAEEGRLMHLYRFAAVGEHEGEHHRVFGDLLQFNRHIKRGRLTLARAYIKDGLMEWFDLHLATMDQALAAHIKANVVVAPEPALVSA